ncbi:30S ribosomal protein S11 [Candidatus Mycoplasma haematobovis]|uniref:Small ribosomal subunit protein uS11 n=1 Tax=Candidatus Mycoplasma haematobovis TaxID=432608 RepID=A0A1A9QFA3_9MOLU|nr:30S ribosomal protein S11 [Candidatus Mycoplasma haematobovis]OAL10389.1 30S ribosomal protein S11 [Candidatus Mycoplasma haematobovis]
MAAPKKKKKVVLSSGIAHISSTLNNTLITITDESGNCVLQESAGTLNYKGTKKATPYVANLVASKIGKNAQNLGLQNLIIKVKGIGRGKEIAIRTLSTFGFNVTEIIDVTPLPHNGCRPPKKPR